MEDEKKYFIEFIPNGDGDYWDRKGYWCDFMKDPKHLKAYMWNAKNHHDDFEEYVITDRTNCWRGEDPIILERGPVD